MLYVAVETQRKDNIGTILRCATAFGAHALVIVGSNKIGTHGAHGAQNRIQIVHFYYWNDAVAFLRQQNCSLYTLLSQPTAGERCVNFEKAAITANTALILRARGEVTEEMCRIADQCVYIQFPGDSQAAEKVRMEVRLSICLHLYRCIHPSVANTFSGGKFDVVDIDKTELHLHSTCHVANVGHTSIEDTGVIASIFGDDGDY